MKHISQVCLCRVSREGQAKDPRQGICVTWCGSKFLTKDINTAMTSGSGMQRHQRSGKNYRDRTVTICITCTNYIKQSPQCRVNTAWHCKLMWENADWIKWSSRDFLLFIKCQMNTFQFPRQICTHTVMGSFRRECRKAYVPAMVLKATSRHTITQQHNRSGP
jgi:hypothetical protein